MIDLTNTYQVQVTGMDLLTDRDLTIDVDNFKSDILAFPLYTKPVSNASNLADQFSFTLRSILYIHGPIKTKTVVPRPHNPWINPEILQAKQEHSRLERFWRRWKCSMLAPKLLDTSYINVM